MSIDLIIPENPEPIIPSIGFAYAIENAAGEIMAATTVLMRADPKSGGLKTRGVNHADAARAMSESIVKFAEGCGDAAVRVRYMTPDEYATWCDDNEDDAPADDDEDGDEFADEDDDA